MRHPALLALIVAGVSVPAAMAEPVLSLDAAPAESERTPLMAGLNRLGLSDPFEKTSLAIYGWVEAGYAWDHRERGHHGPVLLGPIRYDNRLGPGNHAFLNQLTLRFERVVAADKFDVGGLIEVMYGADSAAIHSNGMSFGNEIRTGKGGSPDADDRFHPINQFDIPQAYIDVNFPVAQGLKVRAGKFYGLLGYESIDPRNNPFYTRSYLFNAVPFTHTGVMAMLTVNEWEMGGCIIRGSDQSLEDNNGSIAAVAHAVYKPSKEWSFALNVQVGPENDLDDSHYRVSPDFIVTWQATEKLSFAMELLYMYDGGRNGVAPVTHAYGDAWGAAFYTKYVFNDFVTGNLRFEKYHDYANSFEVADGASVIAPTVNAYEVTLGVTIRPFPKDAIWKNLMVRPETRYDFSEDRVFQAGNSSYHDQWTFAADVVFAF